MTLNHPQNPEYGIKELIAFYWRVEPVLSKWLAKPVWTANETAMLCAGFAPNERSVESDRKTVSQGDVFVDGSPMDPDGYLPADPVLYGNLLRRLRRLPVDSATPREMTERLGISRGISQGNDGTAIELKPLLRRDVIEELHWLFIIGNAVGLGVPAIVPFGLVRALLNAPADRSPTNAASQGESCERPVAGTSISMATSTLRGEDHNREDAESYPLPPAQRGFYTTEEVAAFTNLKPETLTRYARQQKPVPGFTPYKLSGVKGWRWRTHGGRLAGHAAPVGSS